MYNILIVDDEKKEREGKKPIQHPANGWWPMYSRALRKRLHNGLPLWVSSATCPSDRKSTRLNSSHRT